MAVQRRSSYSKPKESRTDRKGRTGGGDRGGGQAAGGRRREAPADGERPGRRTGGGDRGAQKRAAAQRESEGRAVRVQKAEDAAVERHAEEFVLGRRAVLEAVRSERGLNKILVQEGAEGGSLREITALARERGHVIQRVPKARLDEIAKGGSHQGVLAYVAAKDYADLDELISAAKTGGPGLLVVLDGVEDPHNLGAVLRAADGAGAAGVIIPKRRSVSLTGAVAKASAGAMEHVGVARAANISQVLKQLKAAGFWVVGATSDAPGLYSDFDYSTPTAFVIGAEGSGLSRLVAETCDALVRLPMRGRINSLNASVATGILLYEAIRQRG